jgi:predicted membrane protein DUF2157
VAEAWAKLLVRWTKAGLLDDETAARIRAFELQHARTNRLRWPILIALAFGALTLGAGVLLFVSAHWDSLSPQARFSLVLLMIALFHVGGAACEERFPAMATTLQTMGTVALGAGIFLAGQVFNLDEHWPGGLMLWALGAIVAWALLRVWPQMVLTALLVPAWLTGEWIVATEGRTFSGPDRVAVCGLFLVALTYFTAAPPRLRDVRRHALVWVGGVGLLITAPILAWAAAEPWVTSEMPGRTLAVVGWAGATALPLALAVVLRRSHAWPNAIATLWVVGLLILRPFGGEVGLYGWWALGATALAAWGVSDCSGERVNVGAAIFAATILTFYSSHVMDKLGRSASLAGLGVLFLAGGWALEHTRRRLVLYARGGPV